VIEVLVISSHKTQDKTKHRHLSTPPPHTTIIMKDALRVSSNFVFEDLQDFDFPEALELLITLDVSALPEDFVPSNYCVLCGKGKEYFDFAGNHRFRTIVSMHLDQYNNATDKVGKSRIVTQVMKIVHDAGGVFCRFEQGVWWRVSPATAREKTGALFRDCLHTKYRSSGKAKVAARRQARVASRV
jgi:hypothetical protein